MTRHAKPAPSPSGHPGRVPDFDLVRVFVDDHGRGGWPVAVFLAGEAVERDSRASLSSSLPVGASTFVDDRHRGCMETYTACGRLPIALPGMIAAAWLLELSGFAPGEVRSHAGRVATWREGELNWARASVEWARPLTRIALSSPDQVGEALAHEGGSPAVHAWAWEDEERGIVRSRLPASGPVPQGGDEAVGIATLALALGRPLTIHHGEAAIAARPGPDGTVEIGGRVAVVVTTDLESFRART